MLSGTTPIANGKDIGVMDIVELAERCSKIRAYEEPKTLPGWVEPLGWLPAISVNRLGLTNHAASVQRCSLLVSIASLERHVGKLIAQPSPRWYFESDSHVQISLTGFNESSLENAIFSAKEPRNINGQGEQGLSSQTPDLAV